jgi:hypothetical protein
MATINILGVKKLSMGACGALGTMGSTLTEIPEITMDTVVFTTEDDTFFEHKVENYSRPIEYVATGKGKATLVCSTDDISPATMAILKGGTATGTTRWDDSILVSQILQSIEIITKPTLKAPYGMKLQIPKAQIKAKADFTMKMGSMAKIDCVCEVLVPLGAADVELSSWGYEKLAY